MKPAALVPLEVLKAFESVPDLYLVLSPELEVLTASETFLRASRSGREEWVGKNLFGGALPGNLSRQVFSPAKVEDAFRQVLSGKAPHQLSLHLHSEFPCTDGTSEPGQKFLRLHLTPVFNGPGELQYLLVKVEDQTELTLCRETVQAITRDAIQLKKAEEELKQNQQLLQATLDSSLDMIQVFEAVRDESGEITDFTWVLNNHTSEKWYGNVREQSLLQANPGVRETGIFDTFKRVVETGQPEQSERHYVHEQFNGWFLQSVVKLNDGVATTTADITHRKEAEQELLHSRALLQDVINAPNIGIAVYKAVRDMQGDINDFVHEYINRASIAMLGGEDFTGKLFTEHGDNGRIQLPQLIEVVETGTGNSYIREADFREQKVWFSITNTPLDSERLVHTWEDVTERKQAEDQMKTAKEWLQATLDGSLYFIQAFQAVRDQAGKIVDFTWVFTNRVWNEHYGEVIGKNLLQQNPAVVETGLFEKFVQVTETGITIDHDQYYSHEQFHDQWFHQTLVKMGDGFVMNTEDITQRKKAEEEILRLKDEIAQQSTDKYYSLFNSMDEGLSILELLYDDAGKPVDMRWVEVNPAFERITGLKDVAGRLCSEFVPSEQYWLDAYDSVLKTGEPLRYDNYHAGIKQWYRTHTSRVGGPESRVVANVFEDITERKQRERQQDYLLRLSDALRSINNSNEIEEEVTHLAMEYFGADQCYYWVIESDHAPIRRDARREAQASVTGSFPLSSFALFRKVVDGGVPFVVHDIHTTNLLDEPLCAVCLQLQVVSIIDVPVVKNGKVVGIFCLVQTTPRAWTEAEVQLAVETSERIWAAVERARAEETVRESEKRFQSVANLVPDLLWDSEPDGSTNWYNQRWLEYTGQSLEQAIDWGWIDTIHPDDREGSVKRYGEAVEAGQPLRQEHRIRRHDGEYRWFVVSAMPVKDESGHVVKVYGSATDIHDRKQTEEALRKSEEKYRSLFENIDEGFAIQEVLTDETSQVTDVIYREFNEAFTHYSGIKNAIGKKASEFLPYLEQRWLSGLTQVHRTGEPMRMEGYSADLNRWYTLQYARVGGTGSRLVSVVFNDITERKQREEHQAFLLRLSDALRNELDADAVADRALQMLSKQLRLDRCYIGVYRLAVDWGEFTHQVGNDRVPPLPEGVRLSDFPGALQVAFDRTLVIDDVAEIEGLSDTDRQNLSALGLRALIAATLRMGESRPHWSIVALSANPRHWSQAEITLMEEVTERTWTAIEQARSQHTLKKSEEQFRRAIEDAPIPVIMHAEDGEVLQISHSWTELTGYRQEEVPTFDHWLTQAYGEGADQVRSHMHHLFTGRRRTVDIDFPVRTLRGEVRHWSFSASSPGTLQDGRRFIVGMALDITARRRAEEQLQEFNAHLEQQVAERTQALQESKELLEASANTSPLGMVVVKSIRNASGCIVDFEYVWLNAVSQEMAGEEVVGLRMLQRYPHSKEIGLFDAYVQAVEQDGRVDFEEYFFPSQRWFRWLAAKLDDGLYISVEDITERKKAEKSVAEHLTLLRQSEEVARLGSWEYNLQTGAYRWSDGMYRLFGLPLDTPVHPETYLEYVVEEDQATAQQMVEGLRQGREPKEDTFRVKVGEGELLLKVKGIALRNGEGQVEKVLGVDLDLSEVHRLEQENLQMRLEQQKALLLAILEAQEEERRRISESLHNGVAQILYATKLNLDQAKEHNVESGKEENQPLQTVEDLLTEAIHETRRVSHELVPMLLQEFGLKVALESMCRKFEDSALFLQCKVEGLEQRLEPYLEIALFRMSQELVNNIVKHSGATAATLSICQEADQILLQAKDNGRGIKEGKDNTHGIGLKSIQDRVKLLNGSLSVAAPTSGKGTLITITVPASFLNNLK